MKTIETLKSLGPFVRGYLEAAYFTNDDAAPSGEYLETDRPEIMFEKTSPEAIERAIADCTKFQAANSELLAMAGDDDQNGRDFWFTRNRHGVGFWDRDYDDDIGTKLTDASHAFGECWLYDGDDGLLYLS